MENGGEKNSEISSRTIMIFLSSSHAPGSLPARLQGTHGGTKAGDKNDG